MESPSGSAIVLYCHTCGLIRLAENYTGAHARATAHTRLSGHAHIEYAVITDLERLRVAEAFERRSARTVNGYVEECLAATMEGLTSDARLIEAAISDFIVGR